MFHNCRFSLFLIVAVLLAACTPEGPRREVMMEVIATGGFGANLSMMSFYCPQLSGFPPLTIMTSWDCSLAVKTRANFTANLRKRDSDVATRSGR